MCEVGALNAFKNNRLVIRTPFTRRRRRLCEHRLKDRGITVEEKAVHVEECILHLGGVPGSNSQLGELIYGLT